MTILIILTIIALTAVVVFGLMNFVTMILNIMAISKSRKHPGLRNQKQGIVLSLDKTNNTFRLEADQTFITPL